MYIVTAIISLVIGMTVGWFLRGFADEKKIQMKYHMNNVIALVVLLAWFASVLISLLIKDFSVDTEVHVMMGLIVTFFFKRDGKK